MASLATALILAVIGLCTGPIAGIFVDRTVKREGYASSPRCVECSAHLGNKSLIPIQHWFQNCDSCGAKQGMRYIGTDLFVTGLLVAFGIAVPFPELVVYAVAAWVLGVLAIIDFETHLLPNILVWPLNGFVAGLIVILSLTVSDWSLPAALSGMGVFFGFPLVMWLIYPGGLGFGDVKLSITLGLLIGWIQPSNLEAVRFGLYAILASMLLGGLGGLAWNLIRKRGRAEVPFGPALIVGAAIAILLS